MNLTNTKPDAGGSVGLAKSSFLAGMPSEDITPSIIVNRLQHRFGISELHALTVLRLASLGPKEGR
ncbi:MAG TPA: hypothetical protein VGO06_28555 [Bosea sp. (in: a-proteobacteria)]|jgi:hypothetical protein|uniref:hypothetical protein n=1 Tax=Bosea sp. (in: a-proteobacteria) TaxID=1871050 RepID=UPI002E14BDBD|nr:hypothetical protein [Bosea sp. (in: a-proteobacteria)]